MTTWCGRIDDGIKTNPNALVTDVHWPVIVRRGYQIAGYILGPLAERAAHSLLPTMTQEERHDIYISIFDMLSARLTAPGPRSRTSVPLCGLGRKVSGSLVGQSLVTLPAAKTLTKLNRRGRLIHLLHGGWLPGSVKNCRRGFVRPIQPKHQNEFAVRRGEPVGFLLRPWIRRLHIQV